MRFSLTPKTIAFYIVPAITTTAAVLVFASTGILASRHGRFWSKEKESSIPMVTITPVASSSVGLVMEPLTTSTPSATPQANNIPAPTTVPQPTTTTSSNGNPLAGATWYVDPYSNAKQQADTWRSSRPTDAAAMDKIANNSWASWFGEWSGDIYTAVHSRVETAAAAGAVPVLVAYNIPQRDCGDYSAGGVGSPDAYKAWIRSFAQGIGSRKAVVILEPDALASMTCLSSADQQTRLGLLADATNVFKANGNTLTYIDAGHSGWVGAADMASRLQQAGVGQAQGFSLNVSNFYATGDEVAYGKDIAGRIGGKHFVVDTSRNGLGAPTDNQWCNPSGRALGNRPTASTGESLVDAYLWIKAPGESDGTCNGGPSAGSWWPDYALGLAQRASW